VHRSFFLTQLEHRGNRLAAGPQAYLLSKFRVSQVMRAVAEDGPAGAEACLRLIGEGVSVESSATLETAMPALERSPTYFVPAVSHKGGAEAPELVGVLFQVDALRAYNRALAAVAAEEHS
jgi:CIC family chloride channel protein